MISTNFRAVPSKHFYKGNRLLNRNGCADRRLLYILLRNQNGQHAGFVLRLDFLRLHIADIEAAGAGAGITILTQDTTLLAFFVLIKTFLGTDGQITVSQIIFKAPACVQG